MSLYGTHPEYERGYDDGRADGTNSGLIDQCQNLISAIREICKNWERGDLAGAVNNAEGCADMAEDWLVNHGGDE